MNLKTKLTLSLAMLFSIIVMGQDSYLLKGQVVSESDNMGIPGASIVVKDTTNGVASDFEGNFEIEVNMGDELLFSYVGFTTQSIVVTGQTTLNVVMAEDANTLDQIIVIGYGSQKKSHSTGAISQIDGKDIAAVQSVRVEDALAGKLSGVWIQSQDGAPGSDPKIKIRASSSITGNSDPLIVVDGFPISGNLATINPDDIKSLEVLKDAASSAIYGSRGANGVVLVTTKKGATGIGKGDPSKINFSYNSYYSVSSKYRKDNINPTAGEWANTIETNVANGNWDVSEVDPVLYNFRLNAFKNSPDVIAVEDWLFTEGSTNNQSFSMSGGNENSNYYASIGYQNTDGIVITQGFEKFNARANVDTKLGERFKTGLNITGFTSKRDIVGHDMRDLLRAYNVSPIYHTAESIAFVQQLDQQAQSLGYTPFDEGYRGGDDAPFNQSIYTLEPGDTAQDWHYGRSGNGIGGSGDAGPATKLDNTDRWQKTNYFNLNGYLQFSIIDGLDLRTVLGGDLRDTEDYFYRGLEFDSRARGDQTALDNTILKKSSILSETTLNYYKEIGKHEITAVGGIEFQNIFYKGISSQGTNVPYSEIINFNLLNPADITTTERDETIVRQSYFGRANYAYDDRYLLSFSLRYDGDSRFGENNKFEAFPALSLGWNMHNEAFFNSDFINLLKLRFSTGSLGTTSDLDAYSSLSLLNPHTTIYGNGYLIPEDIANPNLTWQTNTETNYGADFGILNSRIKLSADYYTSDIENILINQSVSEVLGTTSIRLNSGDVRSSGFELGVFASIFQKPDFTWSIDANLSTVNTEITDLGGLEELPQTIYGQSGRGPVFRNYVGGEIGEMWGLETIGEVEMVHVEDPTRNNGITSGEYYVKDQQSPGEPGYGEIDNTKTVAEGGDLVKIGQNTPDFYWGLNSSMRYKNADFSFQLQGAQGGEVFNIDPLYYGSQWGGRLRDSFDANDDGIADHNGEHYARARDQTDAMIQDASFFAIRNLTIGYTINDKYTSKIGLSLVRVYLASTNLLYLWSSDYTSFNPEGVETTNDGYLGPNTYGVQVGASPIARSFTFGLNLNF